MDRFQKGKDPKIKREILRNFVMITQIGILMVTTVMVSMFIGMFLDKVFKTEPIWLLVFSLLGIMAAFRNMYYYVMKE